MYKRKAQSVTESCPAEHVPTGGHHQKREFRRASVEEEYAHRSRIEHQQMVLILENFRNEKADIIRQAGSEIARLKKEKEDVIKQSVGEITRLRRELDGCSKLAERVGLHVRKQDEVIEYLRRALSSSESSSALLDPFNHVGAF